jgi:hypothetical protein
MQLRLLVVPQVLLRPGLAAGGRSQHRDRPSRLEERKFVQGTPRAYAIGSVRDTPSACCVMKDSPSPKEVLIPASRLLRGRPTTSPVTGADGSAAESEPDEGAPRLDPPAQLYTRPAILKAVELDRAAGRRRLIIASLAVGMEACDTANIDITTENGVCTCHAVCTCDLDDESHDSDSVRESRHDDGGCTCNTVCTCDSVCTCDTVGGGDSSGGGGSYWY